MTTKVYVHEMRQESNTLGARTFILPREVGSIADMSPEKAISILDRAGVLAAREKQSPNGIVLLGFHPEIRNLLRDLRRTGKPSSQASRSTLGKLRRLQSHLS